ncbi:MAG TPA: hypothetical protein VNM14_23315 [Planctomycetota bacterium]|nr:hypothetical protein [Planctomycetota bacterium]
MKRLAVLVLSGGLGLLALAALMRARPEGTPRRPERPAPLRAAEREAPALEPPNAPVPLRRETSPEGDRRTRALRRTVEALRLGPAEAEEFQDVARGVLARLDAAWQGREAEVLSPAAGLPSADQDARHREAQEEYERSKQEALSLLFGFMAERREYQPLRLRVESWIDDVK